jgi:hypothetical protein
MDTLEVNLLAKRVKRIENGYVFWRVVGIGSLASLAVLLLFNPSIGSRALKTVRASDFVVVDKNGRDVIRLGESEGKKGEASLRFLDRSGKARIVMGIRDDNWTHIVLADPDGPHELVLDVDPQGQPTVWLRDRVKRSGIATTIGSTGISAIGLNNADGNPAIAIGVEPAGSPRLSLYDQNGTKVFEAPGHERGRP